MYAQDEWTQNQMANGGNVTSSRGRWPANLILSHHPECRQVGTRKVRGSNAHFVNTETGSEKPAQVYGKYVRTDEGVIGYASPDGTETVEAWECHPECPVFLLDRQSGESTSTRSNRGELVDNRSNNYGRANGKRIAGSDYVRGHSDTGTASRFFQQCNWGEEDVRFCYQAKAPRRERWFYCPDCGSAHQMAERKEHQHDHDDLKHLVSHPTVKPLDLMRYLVRLTRTPTGGVVFDPFMGSGSTGRACLDEDRYFIGCDTDEASCATAVARMSQMSLFEASGNGS